MPFEPPYPENSSSPIDAAGALALGFGALALAAFAHPVVYILGSLPWRSQPARFDPDAALREAGALHTSAARVDEHGDVECMRCSDFVAYDSMSLNEDGAFCARCVERLTAAAVR